MANGPGSHEDPGPLLFSPRDPSDRTWSGLGLAHHDARGLSDLTAGPRAPESGQRRHRAHRAVRAARGRGLRRGDGPALFVVASRIVSTSPSRQARPGPAPSPRPRDGTEGRSRGRNRECFLTPLFQLIEEAYPAELSPPTLLDGEVEDREGHINHFVGDEKAAQDRGYVSSTCMACVTHLVELEGRCRDSASGARRSGPSVPTACPDSGYHCARRSDRIKPPRTNLLRCRRTDARNG